MSNEAGNGAPCIALIGDARASGFASVFSRLESRGHRVIHFSGLSPMESALGNLAPDIVFFCYSPGTRTQHLAALSEIRQDARTAGIPLVVLDQSDGQDDMGPFVEAGADIILTLPAGDAVVVSVVDVLLKLGQGKRLIAENVLLRDQLTMVEKAKKEWEKTMDCIDDIVLIADADDKLLRCNRVFSLLTDRDFSALLHANWRSLMAECGFETEGEPGVEEYYHRDGKWFLFHSYDTEVTGTSIAKVVTFKEITERKRLFDALGVEKKQLEEKGLELERAYAELKSVQSKLIQQEKLVSIGYLAAGVAHEINNPLSFITSNLGTLRRYVEKLVAFISLWEESLKGIPAVGDRFEDAKKDFKIDHIINDFRSVIDESLDGADRVKRIVNDLKGFSRTDEDDFRMADINAGIESTINIVWSELKYKATLHRDLGKIPRTLCNSSQLNQVFMNLLVNAAQAISQYGQIVVKTWNEDGDIFISVSDTGSGIPRESLDRIFEPFYTTKAVGKGTGLGLSIAFDIIKKHQGDIQVDSEEGRGTTFTVRIPVRML